MTSTPWGPSQTARQLAPGIMLYTTAGHGGIHLSAGRLAALPAHLHKRSTGYCPLEWFEEDCEAALVIVGFPQYFEPATIRMAQRTIATYYPNQADPGWAAPGTPEAETGS
jgi:hypothetical protein